MMVISVHITHCNVLPNPPPLLSVLRNNCLAPNPVVSCLMSTKAKAHLDFSIKLHSSTATEHTDYLITTMKPVNGFDSMIKLFKTFMRAPQ